MQVVVVGDLPMASYRVILAGGELNFLEEQGFQIERPQKVQGRLWRRINEAQAEREERAAARLPDSIKQVLCRPASISLNREACT